MYDASSLIPGDIIVFLHGLWCFPVGAFSSKFYRKGTIATIIDVENKFTDVHSGMNNIQFLIDGEIVHKNLFYVEPDAFCNIGDFK